MSVKNSIVQHIKKFIKLFSIILYDLYFNYKPMVP